MEIELTRKGLIQLIDPDGNVVSNHTQIEEAIERATRDVENRTEEDCTYRIVYPEREMRIIRIVNIKPEPDLVPPPTPDVVIVDGFDQTSVQLSFQAPQVPDHAYYSLYQASNVGGPYTLVEDQITASSTVVSGLTASTTYYFQITATDTSDNTSDASTPVAVTTSDVVVPPNPTNLSYYNDWTQFSQYLDAGYTSALDRAMNWYGPGEDNNGIDIAYGVNELANYGYNIDNYPWIRSLVSSPARLPGTISMRTENRLDVGWYIESTGTLYKGRTEIGVGLDTPMCEQVYGSHALTARRPYSMQPNVDYWFGFSWYLDPSWHTGSSPYPSLFQLPVASSGGGGMCNCQISPASQNNACRIRIGCANATGTQFDWGSYYQGPGTPNGSGYNFKVGRWYDVVVHVRLVEQGNFDGQLEAWIRDVDNDYLEKLRDVDNRPVGAWGTGGVRPADGFAYDGETSKRYARPSLGGIYRAQNPGDGQGTPGTKMILYCGPIKGYVAPDSGNYFDVVDPAATTTNYQRQNLTHTTTGSDGVYRSASTSSDNAAGRYTNIYPQPANLDAADGSSGSEDLTGGASTMVPLVQSANMAADTPSSGTETVTPRENSHFIHAFLDKRIDYCDMQDSGSTHSNSHPEDNKPRNGVVYWNSSKRWRPWEKTLLVGWSMYIPNSFEVDSGSANNLNARNLMTQAWGNGAGGTGTKNLLWGQIAPFIGDNEASHFWEFSGNTESQYGNRSFSVDLGQITNWRGKWVDFVMRYRAGPFTSTTTVYVQSSQPPIGSGGDLWAHTGQSNALYISNGSSWQSQGITYENPLAGTYTPGSNIASNGGVLEIYSTYGPSGNGMLKRFDKQLHFGSARALGAAPTSFNGGFSLDWRMYKYSWIRQGGTSTDPEYIGTGYRPSDSNVVGPLIHMGWDSIRWGFEEDGCTFRDVDPGANPEPTNTPVLGVDYGFTEGRYF